MGENEMAHLQYLNTSSFSTAASRNVSGQRSGSESGGGSIGHRSVIQPHDFSGPHHEMRGSTSSYAPAPPSDDLRRKNVSFAAASEGAGAAFKSEATRLYNSESFNSEAPAEAPEGADGAEASTPEASS